MEFLVLLAVLLGCLVLIPLGLPGTWLIIGVGFGYNYLVPGDPIGIVTLIVLTVLAIIGEIVEFTLSAKYTRQYGGSRRASWGAVIGGVVGAFMGVPIPIIGSVIGAFVGAFVGALVMELTRGTESRVAGRVATGALIGRVVASVMKVGIGVVMAAWIALAAWQ